MSKQANHKIQLGKDQEGNLVFKSKIETEIIVCGGGTSGIIAALSAAESGAKVILLEKNNSCYPPREYIGAVGSRVQKERGIEIDRNEIVKELCRYAGYRVDQRLINLWADESGEMMDWLCDIITRNNMEIYLETDINKEGDLKEWPTSHSFYNTNPEDKDKVLKILLEKMKSYGVNIMLKTPMIQLIAEENRVVGVIAKNSDEEYIKIHASKGVILATGGYSNNIAMLKEVNSVAVSNIAQLSPTPTVTGDGIKAARKIGADMDPIPTTMIFDRAAVKPGAKTGEPFEGKLFWLGSQPFLKVNKFGERYTNESVPYDYGVHAASMQPDKVWCSIFDSNWKEDVLAFHTIGCSRVIEDQKKYPCNMTMELMEKWNDDLLKEGYMQQADTVEALAEKLFIPSETLKKTIDQYNELCWIGEDVDFGKPSFRMRPVLNPPFFGITAGGVLLCTLDGLRINTNMQVLNKEMKPVDGLYAIGNDSGGFFANSYPELIVGVASGRSMTFGRHAGRYLANL